MNYHDRLLHDVVKAFWDERGLGARFRMYEAGVAHFEKTLETMTDLEDGLKKLLKALEEQRIVRGLSHESADKVLTIEVSGCAHREMDEALMAAGVQPILCPIANLVMAAVEKTMGTSTEAATVEVLPGRCRVPIVMFRRAAGGRPGPGALQGA